MMLPPPTTHAHIKGGPATTATQEKPTMALFENYNESSSV